ncbi:MAG: protein translocase subunit SecD [Verrucomicrobia bacterium]|nr:MAG: protein translocase subunit SecD [Verrucomicrobiota bacterium]
MLAITPLEDPLVLFVIGLILLILFFWYFTTEIERRKRNIGSVLLVGVAALCLLAVNPPRERLKGGIDILGGSAFSLKIQSREDDEGRAMPVTPEQVEKAIKVIEKRLNAMGTSEPLIARQGEDGILVQMPGVKPEESARIREILEKVAKLELRQVSARSEEVGANQKTLAQRVADREEIVPGYKAYQQTQKDEDGREQTRPILLSSRKALGGEDIVLATPSPQQMDAVAITLNGDGEDKMIALTQNMREGVDRIAIVLDGEVMSAPVVQKVPLGKNFQIDGLREPGEVENLASALMNPLENPLIVLEERSVSPTLGSAVVKQGITAGIYALVFTFAFVLFYYRMSGLIAIFGLILNGIMLFGIMAMFGFTFTLPGIAGMILTIGMAVDANVLIYERLREELAAGKTLKTAIAASYEKAFTAIFDANITSLITSVILFWLGSGSIKGFAITLTIGILSSMFAAILVTRVMFRWAMDFNLFERLTFMNLIRPGKIDFLGKRRLWITCSLIMVAISLAAFVVRKDKALGIDFTGGTRIQFLLGEDKKITTTEVDDALKGLALSKAYFPQIEQSPTTGTLLTLRCATPDSQKIVDELRKDIPVLAERDPKNQEFIVQGSKEEVSALIGGTFMKESMVALFLGLLGIMIYMTVRFEFSFALGGFIAILHDIVICLGVVVLLGGELSLIHVGAILTIAGYSINDTIIIFDRIRENLLLRAGSGSIEKIMNDAVNMTLSRTVLTSGATLFSVVTLSVLGGDALKDFGFVISIGIIVGTFSSIFIASPIVLWWSSRKGGDLKRTVQQSAAREEAINATP